MSAPRLGSTEWLLLLALAALWGSAFFFGQVAVASLPPLTLSLGRVGLAALALLAVLPALGLALPRDAASWRAFAVLGLFHNAVPFSLILWGQTQIASGLAAILNATTPLFVVLFAHLLTADEKLNGHRLAGVLIGFAGVAAMLGPAALAGLGGNLPAQLACLAAAVSYALAGIYARRFRKRPAMVTATAQLVASTALLLPVALLIDRPWLLPMPAPEAWGALLGIALLGTALAFVLYFRILASAGATNALLVTFLVPVVAILLGALVLGERLAPRHFAGMALIGLGLAAIDGRALGRR